MIALFYAIRQPLTLMMGVKEELLETGQQIYNTLLDVGAFASADVLDEVMAGFYGEVYIAQKINEFWSVFEPLNIEGLRSISFNFGILDMAEIPNWQFFWSTTWSDHTIWLPGLLLFLIPVISGGSQFLATGITRKMNPASPEAGGGAAAGMLKFMPLMSVWFGFMFPAALGFYWTVGTFLQIGQDVWLTKKYTKILDAEEEVKAKLRKEKEEDIEAKRMETEQARIDGTVVRNPNTSKRKKQKSDKQEQIEKAAEWEKKNAPADDNKTDPSRIGNRRYARGRAYDPDRYASGSEPSDDGINEPGENTDPHADEIIDIPEDQEITDDEYYPDDDDFDEDNTDDETNDDDADSEDGEDFDEDIDEDPDDKPENKI